MPLHLILVGPPASGKGTQCEALVAKYGVIHLSTGDLLREASNTPDATGKQAKEYMNEGKLVPDDIIIGIIQERLKQSDCQTNGFLLDGFPRTAVQAKALATIYMDAVIVLEVPDAVALERVQGRRLDPETGTIYHLKFHPPSSQEIKDRLIQRPDDTKETAQVRLQDYHKQIDELKRIYQNQLVVVDGNQSKEQVTKEILKAIESNRVSNEQACCSCVVL